MALSTYDKSSTPAMPSLEVLQAHAAFAEERGLPIPLDVAAWLMEYGMIVETEDE